MLNFIALSDTDDKLHYVNINSIKEFTQLNDEYFRVKLSDEIFFDITEKEFNNVLVKFVMRDNNCSASEAELRVKAATGRAKLKINKSRRVKGE